MEALRVVRFCVAVLVLVSVPLTSAAVGEIIPSYEFAQLRALQAFFNAWKTGTPNLDSNLAGWSDSQGLPCDEDVSGGERWHGVQCLRNVMCENNTSGQQICKVFITGLTINSASLGGILPEAIGNLSTLTTLELTGNPKLTGTLPAALLLDTNLYALDLHDNGFYGEIPDLSVLKYLQDVNLAGNRFSGPFPRFPHGRSNASLQILNLGRNELEGKIPESAFENTTQLIQLDLSSNSFNGSVPILYPMTKLQTLDLSNNRFSGPFPQLMTMNSLSLVNLSSNELTGSFALDLRNSSNLEEMYIDYNNLTGTLNLRELSARGLFSTRSSNSSGSLRVLSLTNNNISDVDYDAQSMLDVTAVIRLEGNPYCKSPDANDGTRCFCTQRCEFKGSTDKGKAVTVAVATSVSSALLVAMVVLGALLYRNNKYKRYLQLQLQQKFEEFEVKPTIFHYSQLKAATRDFHPDMRLGQGAFGAVYKGIFPNGQVMAVKQLFAGTNQGVDEFLNEVVLLTGMKHRNLVSLKGCCIREQQRLLVYEYVDNSDVDQAILAGPNRALLGWPERLKICLGVARGLHYLHALAHPRIVHRDIKAGNVLLTKNYDAKIADFGLAVLFPEEQSCIMTMHVAGTKGYIAPEYASFGQLSDRVDVFSFGVLCLEVISGRRNIVSTVAPDEMYLVKWAWTLHQQDRLMELADRTMSLHDGEKLEVRRLMGVALLCIQNEAELRPSMEQVLTMLQGDSEIAVVKPGSAEQCLESIGLLGSGLSTVKEEGESSFATSSRHVGGNLEEHDFSGGTLELSEIRVR